MAVRKSALAKIEDITPAILVLRKPRVLLDAELAVFYGATTPRLNEQVRRNRKRFPDDFLFELTTEEFAVNCRWPSPEPPRAQWVTARFRQSLVVQPQIHREAVDWSG